MNQLSFISRHICIGRSLGWCLVLMIRVGGLGRLVRSLSWFLMRRRHDLGEWGSTQRLLRKSQIAHSAYTHIPRRHGAGSNDIDMTARALER